MVAGTVIAQRRRVLFNYSLSFSPFKIHLNIDTSFTIHTYYSRLFITGLSTQRLEINGPCRSTLVYCGVSHVAVVVVIRLFIAIYIA